MDVHYLRPLNRAWQRTRLHLFNPFDIGTWLVLGFTAWLANLGSGGGGGFTWHGNAGDVSEVFDRAGDSVDRAWEGVNELFVWLPLVVLGLAFVIGIFLLLLFLSSRGKLIFLDNVVRQRASVIEPWKRTRELGNSLFVWRLCFTIIAALVFVLVSVVGVVGISAAGIVGSVRGNDVSPWVFVALGLFVLLVVVMVLVAVYIGHFLRNFIVPIMLRRDVKATEAWGVFLSMFRERPWPFIAYGLFVFVLWLGVATTVLVLGLLTCCIGLVLVALPYLGTVILLPVWVTYRALGVEFLSQFDDDLDLFAVLAADNGEATDEDEDEDEPVGSSEDDPEPPPLPPIE